MRVCHVAYAYFPSDPRVRKEALALSQAGHEVHVLCLRSDRDALGRDLRGVTIHELPLAPVRGSGFRYAYQYFLFFLLSFIELLFLHARFRFDAIHVHSLPDFEVFVALPERFLGSSVILDLHEVFPEIVASRLSKSLKSPIVKIARLLEALSCSFANFVLVVNDSIRELLISRGIEPSKLTVVANSVDLDPVLGLQSGGEQEPYSDGAKRSIVYVGGLNPERDLVALVRASAMVQKTYPHKLMIVGRGEPAYRTSLQGVASQLGPDFDFSLGTEVSPEEARTLILDSEVGPVTYVENPLTRLALPNKVFEYAAAGKPLVIADLPALRRTFGDAALFYRPSDSSDLAAKLALLFGDPDLRRTLVRRAFRVSEDMSWRKMAARLLSIYSGVSRTRSSHKASADGGDL